MVPVLLVVAGYVLGSMPWGLWLVRIFRGEDIRTVGSGNIGASNVWRVYGRRLGLPAVLLDTAKGFVPAFAATKLESHGVGVLAGGAAMFGHYRPLFLRFRKGGKMVATTGGAFLGVAPIVGGIGAGVWLVVFGLTRYASVASVIGYPWPVVAFAGAAGLGVLLLHRANLTRLWRGEEPRFRRAASL